MSVVIEELPSEVAAAETRHTGLQNGPPRQPHTAAHSAQPDEHGFYEATEHLQDDAELDEAFADCEPDPAVEPSSSPIAASQVLITVPWSAAA